MNDRNKRECERGAKIETRREMEEATILLG
jgi:hypothetical protein